MLRKIPDLPKLNLADSLSLAVELGDDAKINKVIEETFSKHYKGKYVFFKSDDTIHANFLYLIVIVINHTGYTGTNRDRVQNEPTFSFSIMNTETEGFCYSISGYSDYEKKLEKLVMNLEKQRAGSN